jgi:hypothetical protein
MPKPATRKPRTRKPARPTCKVCEQREAELGLICDECNETINQHEELYANGLRGNPVARKALKKLTRTQRQRIVPPMLSEDDIQAFITRGVITGRHQATLRTVRLAGREPVTVHRTTQPKETTVSRKSTTEQAPKTSTSTRKSRPSGTRKAQAKAVEPKPVSTVKPKGSELTAASVARDAGIDGRSFRKFLRSESLKPTTKAQFASAVKKFKAQAK